MNDAAGAAEATAWNVGIPAVADGGGRTPSTAKGGGEGLPAKLNNAICCIHIYTYVKGCPP